MMDLLDFANVSSSRETAVAIGVFDGVHLGHVGLLSQLLAVAEEHGRDAVVVTFENHPLTVLRPESTVTYLMSLERRVALLEAFGVDQVVPLVFTRELSQLTARNFVSALHDRLRMRHLLAGPDFAVGRGRAGTIKVLRDLGGRIGFEVTEVTPSVLGGARVSSTKVRSLLADGAVAEASKLLGRPFRLTGLVVRGDQRGRALGFPTANLEVADRIALPANGIYSTLTHVDGQVFASATSVGVRPTFNATGHTVETFIMDFEANIYGNEISVDFIDRIRPELKFDTVEELVEQMNKDIAQARSILAAQVRR